MDFECDNCGKMFDTPLYGFDKEIARTEFDEHGGSPAVDISYGETIANFCSDECRGSVRQMLLDDLNIKATHPDIGPIEACSRCGGPVDMTKPHLGYVEAVHHFGPSSAQSDDIDYIAVLCTGCEPV